MKIKKYKILLFIFFVALASACSDQDESKKTAEKSESGQVLASNPEIDCEALKNQSGESGFLIPPSKFNSNPSESLFSAKKICLNGQDITRWVVGDEMQLTSAIRQVAGKDTAILTSESVSLNPDDKGYRSEILFLRLNKNGNPERVVTAKNVITSNLHETIESFRITGYDKDESKVYIESPKWTVSNAIFASRLPNDLTSPYSFHFVTDGSIDWVIQKIEQAQFAGHLLVNKSEIRGDSGRDEFLYLVTPEGKKVCEVEKNRRMPRIKTVCK